MNKKNLQTEEPMYAIGAQNDNPQKVKKHSTMGTVEPRYGDDKVNISDNFIKDDALAFIYGAIKKYGNNPKYFDVLKDYIINEAKYINE